MNRAIPFLPGILILLALSCAETECPDGGGRIELAAEMGDIRYQTRGMPSETVPDAFSVWAWVWDTERTVPNYLCGELFTRTGGSLWQSALPHGQVFAPYHLQLWAVGPAGAPGVGSLPLSSTTGAPSFRFTTPTVSGDQSDVVTALSDTFEGTPSVIRLHFRHILSCVGFSVPGDAPGQVVSVALSGVCSEGRYEEGNGWNSLAVPKSFRIEGWQDNLLLLPQTLGSDAGLRVALEQDGRRQVLTAPLSGLELPMGCRTEIRLSFPAAGSLRLETAVSAWASGPEFQE